MAHAGAGMSVQGGLLDRLFAWMPALEPASRRRERLLSAPFPEAWEARLRADVPFWRRWAEQTRADARPMVHAFVHEQRWHGASGMVLTEDHKVVIAACAVRPALRLGLGIYDGIAEIVVYPHERLTVPEHGDHVLGVAHPHGVIVLSWPAVRRGLASPDDGQDTALHEFVHALDLADGQMDGTPPLRSARDLDPWTDTIARRLARVRRGQDTTLDPYAGTNEAELFAVASEHFFERPRELRRRVPDLYDHLARFYGQDPADGEH
jgi:Mlc titration factor MtfA (ptsG expression regulator)